MKSKLNIFFLLAVVAMMVASQSCDYGKPSHSATSGISKVICEESFQNILEQEIGVFEYQYPEASVLPRYLSENAAFDSLFSGKVDLIVVSHDLAKNEKDYLKSSSRAYRSRMIAVDAVAIIVNKDNDIEELSMTELKDIFTGKYRIWGKVTPTKTLKNDSILLVFDNNSSGIFHYVSDNFLNGGLFSFQVYSQQSPEDVFKAVEKHKNAIGFVGVSWITDDMKASLSVEERVKELNNENMGPVAIDFTDRIKVMKVRADDKLKAYKPYQYYINSGDYPLIRKIYAIDASPMGTVDHSFFVFLTSVIGQKIILQTGVMPGAEPVRNVEVK